MGYLITLFYVLHTLESLSLANFNIFSPLDAILNKRSTLASTLKALKQLTDAVWGAKLGISPPNSTPDLHNITFI
jgi:hypothetical protein